MPFFIYRTCKHAYRSCKPTMDIVSPPQMLRLALDLRLTSSLKIFLNSAALSPSSPCLVAPATRHGDMSTPAAAAETAVVYQSAPFFVISSTMWVVFTANRWKLLLQKLSNIKLLSCLAVRLQFAAKQCVPYLFANVFTSSSLKT